MIRIGINGFGRIGRNIVRALYERSYRDQLQLVAINAPGHCDTYAHLLQYDSIHGPLAYPVTANQTTLTIAEDVISTHRATNPSQIPWHANQVDIVFECTGQFKTRATTQAHLDAGANKVLISAPADKTVDATIVYGVNHKTLNQTQRIISNASCTTNCLAPIAKVLHEQLGIEEGLMNTIHAYTNDQVLTDSCHTDLRRARAANLSMIPTRTGAASAVGDVLPQLAGKLDGYAIRVPIPNVSIVDFTFKASQPTTVEHVNQLLSDAAAHDLAGILAINTLPLVSCDFNHHPASAIVDLTLTKVQGNLVKLLAWYDNEWGFANRMLDTALAWAHSSQ